MGQKKHKYTEQDTLNAIQECKKSNKLRLSGRSFKILVITLRDRISNKSSGNKKFYHTILNKETEDRICHCI